MKDKYNFDLILSSDEIKKNRENILAKKCVVRKKLKLKRWVKNIIWLLAGALLGITIYQMFTIRTVNETPYGNYTCYGKIIKVCSSENSEVANYLGV
ncbi:MAG: hypothetical protein MST00_03510 [Tenericutes bacterium]|nr:hypothetical protein [Mycoplasmatota bacterium]